MISVRDPRDIVASYIKIGHRQAGRGMVTKYTKRNLDFICGKITTSYQPFLAMPTPGDIAVISYERLVTDAKRELQRVAADAGLPLRVEAIEKARWLEEEHRHLAETWITELEGRPPTPESIGSFQTLLTNEEVGFVEERCRALMERFGYAPAFASVSNPTRYSRPSQT